MFIINFHQNMTTFDWGSLHINVMKVPFIWMLWREFPPAKTIFQAQVQYIWVKINYCCLRFKWVAYTEENTTRKLSNAYSEYWNNDYYFIVTPTLDKLHEYSFRLNIKVKYNSQSANGGMGSKMCITYTKPLYSNNPNVKCHYYPRTHPLYVQATP